MKEKIEYLLPTRIVYSDIESSGQETLFRAKEKQIGLQETDFFATSGKGYFILDFGKELSGGIRILTYLVHGAADCKIRVRFGESVSESCAELGEKNATNDHALRDIITTVVSFSDMEFCNTGFRFVRIDILEDKRLSIKNIYAKYIHICANAQYCYNGTDEEIAKIFEVAKHTIDLCVNDYVWDGVKRDRLVWVGDIHPEMLAITTLYGKSVELERSLEFVKEQATLPKWMNDMPTYSLWWIIIIADYYALAKRTVFVKKQLGYLQDLIALLDKCVTSDGDIILCNYFLDWQVRGNVDDEIIGIHALFLLAIKKALALYFSFGMNSKAVTSLMNRLQIKKISDTSFKQIIAIKYFATSSISANEANILIKDGAKGISTFMSYYILKTIAETSGKDIAIKIMKEYFGAMIALGATSFWEDFDITWKNCGRIDEINSDSERDFHANFGKFCYEGFRHSLCHGWSSGVISFIKEYC